MARREKRARLANDAMQTASMAEELRERALKLHAQLAAIDETIRIYDAAIDPTAIAPVSEHRRYGKRGAFREALIQILDKHQGELVSSLNVELMLIAFFGIQLRARPSASDGVRTVFARL